MSEPIPTDPVVDPDFPPEDPVPPEPEPVEPGPEMPVVGGWLDAAARAEADAKQYTDEQVPLVAGRMVPRNMDREPTVEDGADLIAGTGWNQYDPTTNDLVQMWRWDGAAWQALDMSAEMIPVLDIGSATVGDLTGDRINVTGTLSANIVDAMDVATKKLVVTEEAILNHATLIGDTVVDNINVTGKLIGTDGVFTGTVDFENVNVTDEVLASKVSGEHLYGTVVEGGEIVTTNAGAGQVMLSDAGFVDPASGGTYPGIRITPADPSGYDTPPGIGPNPNGMILTGGRTTAGGRGFSVYAQDQTTHSYRLGSARSNISVRHQSAYVDADDGAGNQGRVGAAPTLAYVRADQADGARGAIEATGTDAVVETRDPSGNFMSQIRSNGREAYLWSTGSDGKSRLLSVDSDGVWVKSDESGSWKHINLLGSTWSTLSLANGWKAFTGGGGYYAGLRAQRTPLGVRLDGMIQGGGKGQIASLPASMQDVAAKQFPVAMDGGAIGIMAIHQRSSDGWWMLSYTAGPSTPGWISVSVDAALA